MLSVHEGNLELKIRKDGTKYMKTVKLCPRCGCIDPVLEIEYDPDSKEETVNGAPLHIIKRVLNRLKEETGYGIPSEIEESERSEITEPCERPPEADFSETPRNGHKITDNGYDGGRYSPQS